MVFLAVFKDIKKKYDFILRNVIFEEVKFNSNEWARQFWSSLIIPLKDDLYNPGKNYFCRHILVFLYAL